MSYLAMGYKLWGWYRLDYWVLWGLIKVNMGAKKVLSISFSLCYSKISNLAI
jgi:hypothetical protein